MKKESGLFFGLKLILFLISALLASSLTPLVITFSLNYIGNVATPITIGLFGVITLLLGLIVVYIFQTLVDKKKLILTGIAIKGHVKELFNGSFWGIISVIMGIIIIILTDHFNIVIEMVPLRLIYLLAALVMYLSLAIFEELVFRGYLLRKLLGRVHKYLAILISAFAFSLMHFLNPSYDFLSFVNIFLAGVFLAIMYIVTNNIWLIVGFHTFFNFTQSLVGFSVSGGSDMPGLFMVSYLNSTLINGGKFGFEGSYICTIILILNIYLAIRLQINKIKS